MGVENGVDLFDCVAPTRLGRNGTLYTKQISSASQLFYTPDNTTNEYQMTKVDTANFSTFGTKTNYIAPITTEGGWTFLPGGLILQYGTIIGTGTSTAVVFPIPYTSFYVPVGSIGTNSFKTGCQILTNSQFNFVTDSSATGQTIVWHAIGK